MIVSLLVFQGNRVMIVSLVLVMIASPVLVMIASLVLGISEHSFAIGTCVTMLQWAEIDPVAWAEYS